MTQSTNPSAPHGRTSFVTNGAESDFLGLLAQRQSRAGELIEGASKDGAAPSYFHTFREMLQQPWTWLDTCDRLIARTDDVHASVQDVRGLVLTGSGSSEYVGECVRSALRKDLSVTTQVIGGGALLTQGQNALPIERPLLLISIARSGDSPESVGVVSLLLERDPEIRHLVLTCNQDGALAKTWAADSRVRVVVLNDQTNDRSLVMTSSMTNLVLAARFVGLSARPGDYRRMCEQLASASRQIFLNHFDAIAEVARRSFDRAVFLGSGSRHGAARESALKMLEMTAGRVGTLSESWLALRHGPMSYIDKSTLIVCFLSSDPLQRAYESDVLRELQRKQLGLARLIVGENIPRDTLGPDDLVIETAGTAEFADDNGAVLETVVGQLLAFHRCLHEGLRPDSPSESGVINRVVESFTVYRPTSEFS